MFARNNTNESFSLGVESDFSTIIALLQNISTDNTIKRISQSYGTHNIIRFGYGFGFVR